jgi:hypothetical protein
MHCIFRPYRVRCCFVVCCSQFTSVDRIGSDVALSFVARIASVDRIGSDVALSFVARIASVDRIGSDGAC